MKRTSSLVGFAFLFNAFPLAHAAPPAAQPSSAAPPQMSRSLTTAESLRAAVAQAEERLGALEPWQKKLFDDEVLPQASRFVRDFRHTSNGMTVEVDQDAIRKYLAFYAPKALKRPESKDLKLLTLVKVDPDCSKCANAENELKALAKRRSDHRGFVQVPMTPEDLPDPKLSGKELTDKMAEIALKKNVAGVLVLEARPAPIDAIDTAHADETKFQMLSYFMARPEGQTELRHEGMLEVLENDPIEPAAVRLLNDALTSFGSKTLIASQNEENRGIEEIALTVKGVKDYAHFLKLKAQLQVGFRDTVTCEERRISRGQVVFGVRGNRTPAQIREAVAAVQIDASRLSVIEAVGSTILAEIKP